MEKMELAFHVSVAAVVASAIGLAAYGILVISLAFLKVMGQ